ncbi:hypothetical protein RF11_13204 [Thelohanellus kitauei]|uniref:Uncharacterized protein n=1 Tax=Thelohanellus kitauei TaxID=669202 RepID=A0A0C2IY99_THEKT|nr:hypothetical protein RF11_13204 [Thelohanellus kitauei]
MIVLHQFRSHLAAFNLENATNITSVAKNADIERIMSFIFKTDEISKLEDNSEYSMNKRSTSIKKYIQVMIDTFRRRIEHIPFSKPTAEAAAEVILSHILYRLKITDRIPFGHRYQFEFTIVA